MDSTAINELNTHHAAQSEIVEGVNGLKSEQSKNMNGSIVQNDTNILEELKKPSAGNTNDTGIPNSTISTILSTDSELDIKKTGQSQIKEQNIKVHDSPANLSEQVDAKTDNSSEEVNKDVRNVSSHSDIMEKITAEKHKLNVQDRKTQDIQNSSAKETIAAESTTNSTKQTTGDESLLTDSSTDNHKQQIGTEARKSTESDSESSSGRQSVDSDTLQRVLEGWCKYQNLPPQSKKVVRIFVSSTFSGLFKIFCKFWSLVL